MRALMLAIAGLLGAAASAEVVCVDSGFGYDECVINNGLSPPSSDNVIDDATYVGQVRTYVRNVGCPPDWGEPWIDANLACPSPGEATEVSVVSGASVYMLRVLDTSSVEMSGGTVSSLRTYGSSEADLSGGQVSNLFVYDASALTVEDGFTTFALTAYDDSGVTMSGGTVQGDLWPRNSSMLTMTGGTVTGYLKPFDASKAAVSGGWIRELSLAGSSDVEMSGGTVWSHVTAYDSSTVALSGGVVRGAIHAAYSSAITIEGSDFAVDGAAVPYGELSAEMGTLTGTLASGDPMDSYFYQGQTDGGFYSGTITLVENLPEPGVAALHACALLALVALRGRSEWRRH